MEAVARISQKVCSRAGHTIRIEAVRTEREQTPHTPLQAYMDEENIVRHTIPWQQVLMFFVRTQTHHDWASPHYRFTERQRKAWRALWRFARADQSRSNSVSEAQYPVKHNYIPILYRSYSEHIKPHIPFTSRSYHDHIKPHIPSYPDHITIISSPISPILNRSYRDHMKLHITIISRPYPEHIKSHFPILYRSYRDHMKLHITIVSRSYPNTSAAYPDHIKPTIQIISRSRTDHITIISRSYQARYHDLEQVVFRTHQAPYPILYRSYPEYIDPHIPFTFRSYPDHIKSTIQTVSHHIPIISRSHPDRIPIISRP